jgi:hypothetical protein
MSSTNLFLHTVQQSQAEETLLGIDADLVAFFFSVFGALIIGAQLVLARRNRRLAEITAEREWSNRWREHEDGWTLASIVARGPDDYYARGGPELRQRELDRLEADRLFIASLDDPDEFDRQWLHMRMTHRAVEEPIREMFDFLDNLAEHVLNGWLRPRVAYAAVGRDIVRSSAVVRKLVGPAYGTGTALVDEDTAKHFEANRSSSGEGWREDEIAHMELVAANEGARMPHGICGWMVYYPALRMRLLVLLDVIWAEACRRGELATIDTQAVAVVKQVTGSGSRNRSRLDTACSIGGVLRRVVMSWRLRWLLTWAERPRSASGPEDDVLGQAVAESVGQGSGLLGFLRRLWLLRPRLRASPVLVWTDSSEWRSPSPV